MNNLNQNNIETVPSEIMSIRLGQNRKTAVMVRNVMIFATASFTFYTVLMIVKGYLDGFIICFVGTLIMLGMTLYQALKLVPSKQDVEQLAYVADRMETGFPPSHRRYLRFEKNGKWGLYDFSYHRVLLPAKYDEITWTRRGKELLLVLGDQRTPYRI